MDPMDGDPSLVLFFLICSGQGTVKIPTGVKLDPFPVEKSSNYQGTQGSCCFSQMTGQRQCP